MNPLPITRLTLIGLLLLLPGFYYFLRFGSGFVRVLSRKFRRGKPYLKGSASDYLMFALGCLLVGFLGAMLLLAAWLQGGFDPLAGPREVGTVKARTTGPARMHLSFELGKSYPSPRSLEVEVEGVRWALEGESLRWRFGPRWLGFRPGHRIESVLGSSRPDGPPDREPEHREAVSGTLALSHLVRRHAAWVPAAEIRRQKTPWMPAEGETYRILAGGAGYVLIEASRDPKKEP